MDLGGAIDPFLVGGPALALLVSCDGVFEGEIPDPDDPILDLRGDCSELMNSFELSIMFGGGLEFDRGPNTFWFEARGDFGATNATNTSPELDLSNIGVVFQLGYTRTVGR